MKVIFNTGVYYGKTAAQHQVTTLAAQTITANSSGWAEGVHFIYAETTAGSTTCTIKHDQNPIEAKYANTRCMLGSVFVLNGAFQTGSWKFQPWLQITSAERRESPSPATRGGFVSPKNATQLQIGAVEVLDEGIGFADNKNTPSLVKFNAKATFDYKFMYPGYNASASALTTLDTTHLYNITAGTWDDISSLVSATNPKFIVMVPCIAPTGQTLMIPAMSRKSGTTYTQVYSSMEDAINHIYSLEYSLGNVTKRSIFLGQSIVVKVGASDLQDPLQFMVVGEIPQALGGFTTASGQTGGAVASYRPMPQVDWSGYSSFTAENNSANYTAPGNSNVTITMPTPQSSIVNQLEIYFNKTGTGNIVWNTTIRWYTGSAPTFTQGRAYNIILEYIAGNWYGGVLGIGV